ncbi:MAG: Septum formation initiator [Marmoricola sp.]|nr:Septum formation initiator [Marmoricola sp.]
MAVLVVSASSSLRAYIAQRSEINALKAQIASSEKNITSLQSEKDRWKDPAYVETQARLRFGWVMPGETAYQVLGMNGQPLADEDQLADPSTVAPTVPTSWWSKAYGSLEAADHPTKALPPPASKITPPTSSQKQ